MLRMIISPRRTLITSIKKTLSTVSRKTRVPNDGKQLSDFISTSARIQFETDTTEHPLDTAIYPKGTFGISSAEEEFSLSSQNRARTYFVETYGCQMNVADTEIVNALLNKNGFIKAPSVNTADVVLINTCSIREKAEEKIWHRLRMLRSEAKRDKRKVAITVLGCMAERLKEKLLDHDKLADVVCGPDAYRDLPRLLENSLEFGERGINVMLSLEETYADISPIREDESGISAFLSIMRGCNNMCSYCIVPFTRGRERSRDLNTIVDEARTLAEQGVKEITLLGQNVNSYNYFNGHKPNVSKLSPDENVVLSKGFKSIVRIPPGGVRFGRLLEEVAKAVPEVRIRFTSPHPKDFPDDVLRVVKEYPNVCKMIHIPAQSGSTTVLERMRRGYTRESYIELIDHIRDVIPEIYLSSDFISGFCGETEQDHEDTLSLMEYVKYDHAFMFVYSQREKTLAYRKFEDDVDPAVKSRRLQEVQMTYSINAKIRAEQQIGSIQLVLVEGSSKKNDEELQGRNEGNKPVVLNSNQLASTLKKGDFVAVRIESASHASFRGTPLKKTSIQEFYRPRPNQAASFI